jgi:hypothetical protein
MNDIGIKLDLIAHRSSAREESDPSQNVRQLLGVDAAAALAILQGSALHHAPEARRR